MRVPTNHFGSRLNLLVIQPQHDIYASRRLERLYHLDIATALADVRCLPPTRKTLENVASLSGQRHLDARKPPLAAFVYACSRCLHRYTCTLRLYIRLLPLLSANPSKKRVPGTHSVNVPSGERLL